MIPSRKPCPSLVARFSDGPGFTKGSDHHERKFFLILPMVVLGFMPLVCFGLGSWQVTRLWWKESLIEDLEDKLSRAPMHLPKNVK